MTLTGKRIRLVPDPDLRAHPAAPRDPVRRPQGVHHTNPALARRQEARDVQRRPHGQDLGGHGHRAELGERVDERRGVLAAFDAGLAAWAGRDEAGFVVPEDELAEEYEGLWRY